MHDIADLIEKLNTRFNGSLKISENGHAIYAGQKYLIELMKTLKEEYKYTRLADITSVDYEDRYEVVYHLQDNKAALVAIKVKLEKNNNKIPSVVSVWKSADAQEREVYDLMGIVFEGHENLKRILCPDDFVGHPLQKNFKLNPVSRF